MTEIERLENILDTIQDCSYDYNNFDKLDSMLSDEHHQADDNSYYKRDLNLRIKDHSNKYKDLPSNSSVKRKEYHYEDFVDNFKKDIEDQIARLNR